MDGKVDAVASGLPPAADPTADVQAAGAGRATRPEGRRVPTATSDDAGGTIPVPRFKPAEEEIPPNWVFAPGFLYADRRGLVPYPGLTLSDGMVSMVLLRRYLDAKQRSDARAAYRSIEQA